ITSGCGGAISVCGGDGLEHKNLPRRSGGGLAFADYLLFSIIKNVGEGLAPPEIRRRDDFE
ncbi:MAG: hypothetical protein IKR51_03460, partial [Oscillospiraceae bacterium]|nr:hypothetical protein [Oscillospiraceae bacterium]